MVGLSSLAPATAATIATLEPVLTLIWAVLLLGEHLQPVQVAGAALVLAGVTWAQRSNMPLPPADAPMVLVAAD